MKIESKNLRHSPALVFFLLMGVQNISSISVILSHTEFGWTFISSVLSCIVPFMFSAALFFRIPKLLYLPCTTGVFLILCSYVLKFADFFEAGYVAGTEILLLLLYFFRLSKYSAIAYMVSQFGKLKKLWFLPLLLYLAYSIGYRFYINLVAGGGAFNLSILFNLILTVPAYAFLGHWLAHPYKRSYLLKIQNSSQQEENNHA